MKIFVLIKQVPDTETRIKIKGSVIDETGIKWIISPFDEHAIEEAVSQKAKIGAGCETTVVTLGPARCVSALRTAFAMGIDNAVHIKDDSYNVLDTAHTAEVLATYLKDASADLIITGHTAIDSQSSIVPSMIAQHLNIPNINNAIKVEINGDALEATREFEGATGIMTSSLPAILTAAKKLNTPRYPSLKGIMTAKKKSIDEIDSSTLKASTGKIEISSLTLPPARPSGRIIEGDDSGIKAKTLVKALREEAKVI